MSLLPISCFHAGTVGNLEGTAHMMPVDDAGFESWLVSFLEGLTEKQLNEFDKLLKVKERKSPLTKA